MTSYKPVIYAFAVIGVFGAMGLGYATVQAFKQIALMPDTATYNYDLLSGSGSNEELSNIFSTSSNPNLTMRGEDDASGMTDDSYLGTGVMYESMQDADVLLELKLPDGMDLMLKSLLARPDTTLKELFRSDTHLALKMTALDEELQSILVQDLRNGSVYDTKINARANFLLLGSQIVYVGESVGTTSQPDELTQVFVYNIDTNETKREAPLPAGSSYTKKVEPFGPVADLKVGQGKIEVSVYSTESFARFDTDRTPVRTVSYPSGQ
jgi:hypothetical protein